MNTLTRSLCTYFPLFMKTIFSTYNSTLVSKQQFHFHEALIAQIILRSLILSLLLLLFHVPQKYRTFWLINILKSQVNIESLCCASGTNRVVCQLHFNKKKSPKLSVFKTTRGESICPSLKLFFCLCLGAVIKRNLVGFPGGAVVENLPASAGDTDSSPGLGRSHMPWSDQAREPQLLSLRVWSLCSTTREAAIVRGPCTAMKSGPRLPQLEKALTQKRRPNTAINK